MALPIATISIDPLNEDLVNWLQNGEQADEIVLNRAGQDVATHLNTVIGEINTGVSKIANDFSTTSGVLSGFENDGGGNLGFRFNSTSGATNTLVEDGIAYELEVSNDSAGGNFSINRGSTTNGLLGETITWTSALTINGSNGNITTEALVNGRNMTTDGTKLDGIESGATADQTKADIDALGINAAKVGDLFPYQFLRSDVSDTMNGVMTFNQKIKVIGGSIGGISLENDKHWITTNDGYGNFNVRIGHKAIAGVGEEVTENGFACHLEMNQTTGEFQFNVLKTTQTIGYAIQPSDWNKSLSVHNDRVDVNANLNVTGDLNVTVVEW